MSVSISLLTVDPADLKHALRSCTKSYISNCHKPEAKDRPTFGEIVAKNLLDYYDKDYTICWRGTSSACCRPAAPPMHVLIYCVLCDCTALASTAFHYTLQYKLVKKIQYTLLTLISSITT